MKEHVLIALRMTIVIAIITCGIYPLVVFTIAQVAFRDKANGSWVRHGSRIIGSR